MIEALQRFILALRRAGLVVSPAEAIDAARAMQAAGVEERETFRIALRATLAKTRDGGRAFDRVFDRFFAAPAPPKKEGRRGRGVEPPQGGEGKRPRPRPPELEETPAGRADRPARDERPERRRLRPGRLIVIQRPREAAPMKRVEPARRRETPRRGGRIPRQFDPRPRRAAAPATTPLDPRHLDLKYPLTGEQETLVAREVPRLIQEIRLRVGRRRRPGRTGRLWTARLMRSSVATGGVPFVIPYRERRPRRPRLIVLADVSWSVMRTSSLFLQLASAFVMRPHSRCRVSIHLFVDRCVEATETLARWKGPGEIPFSWMIDSLPGLNAKAPSDYGSAFYQAAHSREGMRLAGPLRHGGRDAVLVVLGDARSNFGDPQGWAFEDLAMRCRRVIWLNPEPASLWDTGDSVLSEYLPSCDLVCEARDLDGIARGVAEIVRSL